MSKSIWISIMALSLLVGLAGCGSSTSTSSSSSSSSRPGGSAVSVMISGYAYKPAAVTVAPGAQVTFSNHDSTAHTATSSTGSGFDTGSLKQGQSKTVTLKTAGTYSYICQFHPFMHGTVTVK